MMEAEPTWDLYQTFLAVLSENSLAGAARVLGLTRQTVACQIKSLEDAVGCDLFIRSQRGLEPTEVALELRSYAEALASTSAALLRAASGYGSGVKGRVRVSASEVVGVEVLPTILAALRAQYPDLVIELVLSNGLDGLRRREADVAVRMAEPAPEAFVSRHVGSITLGLHAHERYLNQRGVPATLKDLSRHDLVGFDRRARSVLNGVSGFERTRFALRADSDLAQFAAIRAGFGIGVCQAPLAARSPELVRVLADAFKLDLSTYVVMHEDLRSSPRCRVVFDALVDGLTTYTRAAQPLT
ncbi:LysR family transcriptional regulator [Microvirga sp. VF16]|uniref:LysR family transcriptional regulator n=1 Tax=Microvirga sp. VF16 TaxID=2807101 RepID=UPI00193D8F67|nr:LysR family transcriptional regulator [Microvirga sp. VF16]QRM33601.1 LysR family transcriptional regulator [Microvirga sp. VF16]